MLFIVSDRQGAGRGKAVFVLQEIALVPKVGDHSRGGGKVRQRLGLQAEDILLFSDSELV